MRIKLLRSGNVLVISPTTPEIRTAVCRALTFTERKMHRGQDRVARAKRGLSAMEFIRWECFAEDHRGRICASYGFKERLIALLKSLNHDPVVKIATHSEHQKMVQRQETVYKPRWDRIEQFIEEGFDPRHKQFDALKLFTQFQNGRISCSPGYGKGTLIMLLAMLYPKAKIDVVTDSCAVLTQRLYPELALNLPSVGIVGCKRNLRNQRVMCYNADSLHHARPDADFVLVDEGDQACADGFAYKLGMYRHARMWAFSGSWDMRIDNKNMRAEAMFGPIRMEVGYEEARQHKIVVPIRVYWSDVIRDLNPCTGIDKSDTVERKRAGIWNHRYRNKIIRDLARMYDDDTQVLIPVETVEHMLQLKKLLPEFTMVWADRPIKAKDLAYFREMQLIDDNFRDMTSERRERITKRFSSGRLKKVIATTVWNVGVDFTHLEVLIRGDAGSTPTGSIQIPGRASRTNEKLRKKDGPKRKEYAIVHDLRDQFDAGFCQRAGGRLRDYRKQKWTQYFPNKKGGVAVLNRQTGWVKENKNG